MRQIIVDNKAAKQRLDVFLCNCFAASRDPQIISQAPFSRARVQKLIKDQNVLINNRAAAPSYKVRVGDNITYTVPPPHAIRAQPQAIPLSIIYEDRDIIVINKPKGMVVHPAAGNAENTLVNALLHHVKDLAGVGGALRPGIVHRLDKDTSGVMVIAKNDLAHQSLTRQFKDRVVKKTYWAWVHGIPRVKSGKIETRFGRHPVNRKKMAVFESPRSAVGKSSHQQKIAITNYKVLKTFDKYSLLAVNIETGRTHQIRVHLNYLGHPVVGDQVYGKRKNDWGAKTQLLHAKKIAFLHPRTGKLVEFEAPLPAEFVT
ncbi:MAG: RluA family pseudouridine synthase [Candidatus Margulisiibacteriota bacterium]